MRARLVSHGDRGEGAEITTAYTASREGSTVTIEIRDSALEAQLPQQVQAIGAANAEEALVRLLDARALSLAHTPLSMFMFGNWTIDLFVTTMLD